ncbi:MAG: alanine racemase [Ignavibacteriales bacterium]|nr:alanine racemase [Ignavibacteriales bacterium]
MNSTIAEINIKNLVYNYNSIRRKTKTKVMAVVKADAYGHGMVECVKVLESQKNSPEYYGVALLQEAIELRDSRVTTKPILCFAPIDFNEVKYYKNIIPTITSEEQIEKLQKVKLNYKLKIHININTGMNRLGINFENAIEDIKKISKIKNIIIDGIYTHFATSDEKNKKFAHLQLNRFTKIVEDLKNQKISFGLAHAANSGAVLDMTNSYFDMVRPGISLYGYYPSLETSESIKLKPVMSVKSKISHIMEIDKGETVGYGRLFKVNKKTRIGTLPIGYADGLSRGLSTKLKVISGNNFAKQLGRISMDRISIEIPKNTKLHQEAILLGRKAKLEITAWDWSKILKTIPYEITCGISKRIPRIYVTKF